jgi:tRNA-modifying protein YgfZ
MTTEWFDVAPTALVDRITATGADAATYLHSQLSQDVLGMAVGDRRWTFVLQPTGKVESLAIITRTGDESFELATDVGFGTSLLARLQRFKIRVAVDLAVAVITADQADVDTQHASARASARVAAVWPAMGSEITPGETIPAETGIVAHAVSFTKGCYPGQELVERMDSRGSNAPRALRRINVLAAAIDAAATDDVLVDGQPVGVITTAVAGEALALIARAHLR